MMSRYRFLLLSIALIAAPGFAAAQSFVVAAGSFQNELGCSADWQADCATTGLAYDAVDDVWQGTFNLPAGSWEYRIALDEGWTEAYPGSNVNLSLGSATDVKFYYDHKTHFVADSIGATIAVVVGTFQSEIGCSGDWDPACLRGWLTDVDGDGTYTFMTTGIPAGDYEAKVAHNEAWDESYPGSNVPFSVPSGKAAATPVLFLYDATTHDFQINVGSLPVEFTSFDVVSDADRVILSWTTASETDNSGFSIEHQTEDSEFRAIGFVEGHGTSDIEQSYGFEVRELDPGLHRFRLRQIDFDGSFAYSPIVEAYVAVPDEFFVEPAYPNPFNPSTRIRLAVGSTQRVVVTLTDASGRVVRELYSGTVQADQMQTVSVDGSGLASGTYQVTILGERFRSGERIVLLK